MKKKGNGTRRCLHPDTNSFITPSLHRASTDALIYTLSSMQHVFNGYFPAASSNPETVKTLKAVFESLRTAAKTYSQVSTVWCGTL